MIKKKRGFVADHIRWMFVLIAGGAVMLFFYQIITAQQTAAEQKLAAELAVTIGNLAAGVFPVSTQTITLPETVRIEYDCPSKTLFVNGAAKRFTGDAVVFVQPNLRGSRFELVTRDFVAPFTAATAVFIMDADNPVTSIENTLNSQNVELQTNKFDNPGTAAIDEAGCGRTEIYRRTKLVAEAHLRRMSALAGSPCAETYLAARAIFSDFTAATVSDNAAQLEDLNKAAVKNSCPAIY